MALLPPSNWPNAAQSRLVACPPHLWHVQDMGSGPLVLLIHGAGGATHSFRHLIPLLTPHYRVIAIDLPGQGFSASGAPHRSGLDGMAKDLAALLKQEAWQPTALIGHSAGAAIALRMAEDLPKDVRVVGVNAALGTFEGVAGWLFPALAKALALMPFVPNLFSKLAGTPTQVRQLIRSTGSTLDQAGEAQYLYLLRSPTHVGATLAMMAQWDLSGLLARLARLTNPCLLITAQGDLAVPPATSDTAAARLPQAQVHRIAGFGHLVHEEAPDLVASEILRFLAAPT